MLDLNWLNTFVTLAKYEHFGKTAIALHMTQPNVSLQIKQLEQVTRVKLIERNPFRLTQAGERLLASAENALMELQICQADLNAINELNQGTLSIAASDIISRLLLIGPFQSFRKEFPGIDLSLFNTTSSQAAELVKSAKADLGFVIAQKESQPLHFTELRQVKWCALGNGLQQWQALAENREITTISAEEEILTADEPTLILLGHDTRTRDLIDLALPSLNLPKYRIMEVGSVDAQIDWAEAGFGVAIIPAFSVHSKLDLKTKITPLPDFPTTSLGYIVRQNQVLSRAIKQLLGWVDQEIQKSQ
ncbi:LysR family transcriptional regulator [Photobacterium damselae]|uniref:LysR family transcriptional regulator n=1 Tax=Photobacterium damselae TaxID=38293 RepID=A0ABD6X7R3_PHODM|nr:LysR family transcriptional regulator [Photobacterium damselae]OBU43896.1 LysR family transcriptional regulator [Photobacterium damselae]ODA24019.1 LysR family transcriptional regulator [Photobacterium damselae subsp. damselae]PSU18786.1 LysR family transcriptional regulator [Photobacterium damselae]TLS77412.1 LysR family transcriptional regulator [Photobacterium damselae subsp. damselae]TLS89539.1 LysR family transcriptional regulator [Photobacterium damselae subsp. damselae]